MSMVVLCPSLGRPGAARQAYETFLETRALDDTTLLFVLNEEDDVSAYDPVPHLVVPAREWMNEILQEGVDRILEEHQPSYVGFIGDDNRFRTPGWDQRVTEFLDEKGGGFAFGNDLIRHGDLPCHVFASASIVKALGYFGLRGLHHLYIDNAWKVIGLATSRLFYLPDVIIEHLHPASGKGQPDESYAKSNSTEVYSHDGAVFVAWVESGLENDAEIVRSVLG